MGTSSALIIAAQVPRQMTTEEHRSRVVQVDNPDPDAHYPVVLAAPAAAQRLALLPSALDARPVAGGGAQALALRAAMWRRRPAGVLCVERIEVSMYIVTSSTLSRLQAMWYRQGPGVVCVEPVGSGGMY